MYALVDTFRAQCFISGLLPSCRGLALSIFLTVPTRQNAHLSLLGILLALGTLSIHNKFITQV